MAAATAAGDDDASSLPKVPSIISLGSLPPQIDGPVTGYVRLSVKLHIQTANANGQVDVREWLVRVRWWGSMATVGKGDLLREHQLLCFPVHVARDVFRRYLDDMAQLRFDVVDKVSHRVYGQAAVQIRLDDLEAPGRFRRDIVVVQRGGEPHEIGGTLTLDATVVWSDPIEHTQTLQQSPSPQQAPQPLRRFESDVRVWKNKDFPPLGQLSPARSTATPLADPTPAPSSTVFAKPLPDPALKALLLKGESLRRAMQRAIEQHETESDIPTILASAKSFGPLDLEPAASFPTTHASQMLAWEFPKSTTTRDRPTSPKAPLTQQMMDTPLEMLFRMDWLRGVLLAPSVYEEDSADIYVTHKALQPAAQECTSESRRVRFIAPGRRVSSVALDYQAVLPCLLTPALVRVLDSHQLVVEVWMQFARRSTADLVGLAKVPLKPFGHAFRNTTSLERQIHQTDPFVGVSDGLFDVKNPFSGAVVGSMTCTVALGTSRQIQAYQSRFAATRKVQAWWRGRRVYRRRFGRLTKPTSCPSSVVDLPTEPFPDKTDEDPASRHPRGVDDRTVDNARLAAATTKIQRVYRRWRQRSSVGAHLDWSDLALDIDHDDNLSTTTFGIDEDTIKLLNDPTPQLSDAHSHEDADDDSVSSASAHEVPLRRTRVVQASGSSWRLVLELTERCPHPDGLELRYAFRDTVSTLWWDSSSTILSTRNEHTYDGSHDVPPALELEILSPHHGRVGHARLHLSSLTEAVRVVWVPITWTHATLDRVDAVPLRVHHAKHNVLATTAAVTSTKLLPATATIRVQVTSVDLVGTDVDGWQVFVKSVMEVGVDVHPKSTTTEYDTALRRFVSYQTSSMVALAPSVRPDVLAEFDEHVVIHPALLDSMQEAGVTLHLYRHVMDMDIRIGAVSVPLATLLYRNDGVRGIFPFQEQDGIQNGRLGVNVFFLHHRAQSTDPTPRVQPAQNDVDVISPLPAVDPAPEPIDMNGQSIHEIDFLLDETPSHEAVLPCAVGPQALVVVIEEARNLWNDAISPRLPMAYASFQWGSAHYETPVANTSSNPKWMTSFDLAAMADPSSELVIRVFDRPTALTATLVGHASIDLALFKWTNEISGWYHVTDASGHAKGQVKVRISGLVASQLQNSAPPERLDDAKRKSSSILQSMVQDLAAMDAALVQRHHDDVTPSVHADVHAENEASLGSSCADTDDLDTVPTVDALPSPTRDTQAEIEVVQDESLQLDLVAAVSMEPEPSEGGKNTWDNDDLDMNALEIYGSPNSASGDSGASQAPSPQSRTTPQDLDPHHDDAETAMELPAIRTFGEHSNASDMEAVHGTGDVSPLFTSSSTPRTESNATELAPFAPPADPEVAASRLDDPTDHFQVRESSGWSDDDDGPRAFRLTDLNIHTQPNPTPPDRANSRGSSKMDIHELETVDALSDHASPTLPTASARSIDHPILHHVLEVVQGLQSQISSLVQRNEEMALKIAEIPHLVAESCSDRLTASRASSVAMRDTIESVGASMNQGHGDSIGPAVRRDASTQLDGALDEDMAVPIAAEPRPVQVPTPTPPNQSTPAQQSRSPIVQDSTVMQRVDFPSPTKLRYVAESVQTETSSAESPRRRGEVPLQFWRYLDQSVDSYLSPPAATKLVMTEPLSAAPDVHRAPLQSPRRWTCADDESFLRLPPAFRVTNRLDADQPQPGARVLFDSETERIAKIMCGNLQHWMIDHESSSEED